MSDLVEQLRTWPGECDCTLGSKAADEIEALRAALKKIDLGVRNSSWIHAITHTGMEIGKLRATVEELEADNSRLRAAIESVLRNGDNLIDWQRKALAALEDKT